MTDSRLAPINHAFLATRLIAAVASADPYVVNESVANVIGEYSTGLATLPMVLQNLIRALSDSRRDIAPEGFRA